METSGITISCYNNTVKMKKAKINALLKIVEDYVKAEYPDWSPTTSEYGIISQVLFLLTNFAYNIKVLQLGETKMSLRNINGEVKEHRISDYGFDINKHAQLAKGLQMKPTEASTQKTSIGFATTLIHYYAAQAPSLKAKWLAALDTHLIGLPRKEEIKRALQPGDFNSKQTAHALAELFLLLGDRVKHRFALPPAYVFEMITSERTPDPAKPNEKVIYFDKEKIELVNFSDPAVLRDINNFGFFVPKALDIEKVKFIITVALLDMMYDDLGVLTTIAQVRPFTRKDVGGIFKPMRDGGGECEKVTFNIKYASKMRKAHQYDLNLSASTQLSSEPSMGGKRSRIVDDLKLKVKRQRTENQLGGDIPDFIRGLFDKLAKDIHNNTPFGKHKWIKMDTMTECDLVPIETGKYYFNNDIEE